VVRKIFGLKPSIELGRKFLEFPNLKLLNVKLDIVKIAGEPDTFRLRIGDYRALFKIYEREKTIVMSRLI